MDVRDPPAARIEHLDLADELAGTDALRQARPLHPRLAFDDEQELASFLPDPHDRLAVRVLTLLPEREDRVEQLAREQREDVRILDESLVAAAVEEQWPTFPVAGELDLAEEQRVIATPVRADDASDEMRERTLDERCLVHDLERRLREVVRDATCEAIRQPR